MSTELTQGGKAGFNPQGVALMKRIWAGICTVEQIIDGDAGIPRAKLEGVDFSIPLMFLEGVDKNSTEQLPRLFKHVRGQTIYMEPEDPEIRAQNPASAVHILSGMTFPVDPSERMYLEFKDLPPNIKVDAMCFNPTVKKAFNIPDFTIAGEGAEPAEQPAEGGPVQQAAQELGKLQEEHETLKKTYAEYVEANPPMRQRETPAEGAIPVGDPPAEDSKATEVIAQLNGEIATLKKACEDFEKQREGDEKEIEQLKGIRDAQIDTIESLKKAPAESAPADESGAISVVTKLVDLIKGRTVLAVTELKGLFS